MPHRRGLHPRFIIPEDITFIVPVEPITKLAFCGGGAKGVAYPGAITALHEIGLMNQIDTVAGSSAGSFIALLVSLGCDEKEIKHITDDMTFLKFLDVSFKNNIKDRGICNGKKLYEMIQKVIKNKINYHIAKLETFLQQLDPVVAAGEDAATVKLHLLTKLQNLKNSNSIKFSDLEILRNCYKYYVPEQVIKDLIVTGTNITDKELAIFSAKTSPDMEIAKAIQISAAFPIVFKAVNYKGKQYIDGGAMDNLPVRMLNAYSNDKKFKFLDDATQCQRTLSLMLGRKDTYHALHKVNEFYSGGFIFTLRNLLSRLVCKINFLSNNAELLQALHHQYGLRTVALPTHGVGTLAPSISAKTRARVTESSNAAVKEYFTHRTDEAHLYREKDMMASLLQIVREKPTPKIYQAIIGPIFAANPGASPAEKKVIKNEIVALTNSVLELNREKDKQALELLTKIKALNGTLTDYLEFGELNPIYKGLFTENLITRKALKIDEQIKEIQKIYEKYILSKEITQNNTLSHKSSLISRHSEILLDRFNPYQDMIYQLIDNLHHFENVNKKNNVRTSYRRNTQSSNLLYNLEYFEFQRKKAVIIKILVASKAKYFQRDANIKLLSKTINDVRTAKHEHDVRTAVGNVKQCYKPRTFFSIKKMLKDVFTNDFMSDTSEKLDSVLNNSKSRRD